MSFKSKLMELINGLPDEDEEGTDADGLREGDGPTDTADQVANGATDGGAGDGGIDENIDEDIDASGDGSDADDASGDDADDGDEDTLPESDVSVEQLRASLVKLGIENERLRTRLAELGGDAALTTDLDVDADADADADDEVDMEDDEAAQAAIDDQKKQIAALRGDN